MITHIDVEFPKIDTRRANEESRPENKKPKEVEGQSSTDEITRHSEGSLDFWEGRQTLLEAVWMSKVDGPFEGCK